MNLRQELHELCIKSLDEGFKTVDKALIESLVLGYVRVYQDSKARELLERFRSPEPERKFKEVVEVEMEVSELEEDGCSGCGYKFFASIEELKSFVEGESAIMRQLLLLNGIKQGRGNKLAELYRKTGGRVRIR